MKHERTELELHVIDHFSKLPGWDDNLELEEGHCLAEFLEAYKATPEAYASTPEELELINKFIEIVEADIHGADFTAEACNVVIKAIETFGL
jgi:hypothetical protein